MVAGLFHVPNNAGRSSQGVTKLSLLLAHRLGLEGAPEPCQLQLLTASIAHADTHFFELVMGVHGLSDAIKESVVPAGTLLVSPRSLSLAAFHASLDSGDGKEPFPGPTPMEEEGTVVDADEDDPEDADQSLADLLPGPWKHASTQEAAASPALRGLQQLAEQVTAARGLAPLPSLGDSMRAVIAGGETSPMRVAAEALVAARAAHEQRTNARGEGARPVVLSELVCAKLPAEQQAAKADPCHEHGVVSVQDCQRGRGAGDTDAPRCH